MSKNLSLKRSGFTIVEVLVVISIISLLLSLVLPAMKEAREMADATRCQACLRQTGVGISS